VLLNQKNHNQENKYNFIGEILSEALIDEEINLPPTPS